VFPRLIFYETLSILAVADEPWCYDTPSSPDFLSISWKLKSVLTSCFSYSAIASGSLILIYNFSHDLFDFSADFIFIFGSLLGDSITYSISTFGVWTGDSPGKS